MVYNVTIFQKVENSAIWSRRFIEIGEIKGVPTTSGRVAGMRNVSVPTVVHNQ